MSTDDDLRQDTTKCPEGFFYAPAAMSSTDSGLCSVTMRQNIFLWMNANFLGMNAAKVLDPVVCGRGKGVVSVAYP
ncbi:MAG TPA: hypothetical protein VM639_18625 [Dongiaceae bacterium]|nr:hypothetical protein [Dongiaceae bacterium]